MNCEPLESRRLFAVDVSVANGVLTVTGDEAANLIHVRLTGEDTLVVSTASAVVEDETATDATATTDDAAAAAGCAGTEFGEVTTTEFDISDDAVTSILIDLGDGDDRASVGRGVTLAATLNGGAGNDSLAGGAGDDTIDGGDGNDHLRGGLGADTLGGGAGNDVIHAADGVTDTIDGGDDATDADGSSGDVAVIDAADGTAPDTVSNVEATRTGFFGFGGHGFGGGHRGGRHHHGPPPTDNGTTDDGTTTGDTATTTAAAAPAAASVLNVFGVNRPVSFVIRR